MSSSVLIADGHRSRSRRLGDACAARGFSTTFAEDGAAALEAALSEVPDVVIASPDLPLIDARRLSEILRANPRTQDTRFVFLAPEGSGPSPGYFDETLSPASDADDVALRVEAILAQRARIHEMERETGTDHEVQGKLSQIPLTDLLQLFHMNGRTGTLELSRREAGGREERGAVLMRDGNVVQASVGKVEGDKALFRLLAWQDGSFAFVHNRVNVTPRILTPTRALLMEGVRQIDEWDRMRSTLPPLDGQITLTVNKGELPNIVHPLTQEVLLLLEIYDRVRDVVDGCSYPDYQVLRTLQTLVERNLVELRRDVDRPPAARREALFDMSQVRRLRDWLQLGRPRGATLRDAKLLLASPDADGTRDLVRLLSGLPGVQISEAFEKGDFTAEDLEVVGRLSVDDGLGIQIVHVPTDPAYAPLWPVVAHGALGTLLVLSSPGDETRLRCLGDTLRRLPRSRIFHLLLRRKGEKLTPEELQEKVSLLDDASLFLLQIEGTRDSVSLLRTMLARVLP